jgi:hypothetical protein
MSKITPATIGNDHRPLGLNAYGDYRKRAFIEAIKSAIAKGTCEVIGQTTTAARYGDADGQVMDVVQDNQWQRVYHVPAGSL